MSKYTKFGNNGSAPSYTPKTGDTTHKTILKGIKNALKTEKSSNQIKKSKKK